MRPNRRMPGTQRPAKQEPPVSDHRESALVAVGATRQHAEVFELRLGALAGLRRRGREDLNRSSLADGELVPALCVVGVRHAHYHPCIGTQPSFWAFAL